MTPRFGVGKSWAYSLNSLSPRFDYMPASNAIIFIDGNNLYHCLRTMGVRPSTVDYLKLCDLVCAKFNLSRKKTIYYNSVPSIASGAEVYYGHMRFLSSLEDLPRFEVKKRKLQRNSNKEILEHKKEILERLNVCKACHPIVEQNCMDCIGDISEKEKGVDVLIAVDMIEKALKKECDYCVLISGDGDFVPALQLIIANSVKIKSASVPAGYSALIRKTFPNDYFVLDMEELEKIRKTP